MTADSETTAKEQSQAMDVSRSTLLRFNNNFRISVGDRVMQGVRILPAVSWMRLC
jgi:hypothetical protein